MQIKFKPTHPSRKKSRVIGRVWNGKGREPINTGLTVPTQLWLSTEKMSTNLKAIDAVEGWSLDDSKRVNSALSAIRSRYTDLLAQETKTSYPEPPDLLKVISKLSGKPQSTTKYLYLIEAIEAFIQHRERTPNPKSGRPFSANTIKTYRTSLAKFQEFEQHAKRKFKCSEVNREVFEEWCAYAFGLNYSPSYVSKVMDPIKSGLKWAQDRGAIVHDDILLNKLPKYQSESWLHPTLDKAALDKMLQLDLKQGLERARDLFVIGCWTALRVSDLMKIEQVEVMTDAEGDYLQVPSTKVKGTYVELPVHPHVQQIRERWGGWPRTMNDQIFNERIKTICKQLGMTEKVKGWKMKKVKIKGKEVMRYVEGLYPTYELVSAHSCRRSFATNFYGILDAPTIMAATGHTSERTFLKYIHKKPAVNRRNLRAGFDKL